MRETNSSVAYEVTWLVRRLFRAMSNSADRYLQDFGISSADRAVMEFLYPNKELSVPQIASQYSVSRQHVQVTVNDLLTTNLLQSKVNPKHKRSPLISLTGKGRVLFANIRRKDGEVLQEIFANLPEADVLVTRTTLRSLVDKLSLGDVNAI